MAKRGRKSKTAEEAANPAGSILAALSFLKPAAVWEGPANQTHCMLRNKTATIFNGLIAIGALVDIPANCNPHLLMLISALERCKESTTINYTEHGLEIKSGRYRATIPCLPDDQFGDIIPSNPIAPLNDAFKTSIEIVGRIAVESAPCLLEASVFVRTGSAIATDGVIMFEHWHGNSMPDMTVPKVSVAALCKIEKKLTSFGCIFDDTGRTSSITFWFEDSTWFRTQLYVEPWPSLDKVLEVPANLWPIPAGLWEGLDSIKDFVGDTNAVILSLKTVRTHEDLNDGASFEIEGSLPERLRLNHELLSMFSGLADKVDWIATPDLVKFQGDNFRGVLTKMKSNADQSPTS